MNWDDPPADDLFLNQFSNLYHFSWSMHALAWAESNRTEHDKLLNMTWEIYGCNKNQSEKWPKLQVTLRDSCLWGAGKGEPCERFGGCGNYVYIENMHQILLWAPPTNREQPLPGSATWGWSNTQRLCPHKPRAKIALHPLCPKCVFFPFWFLQQIHTSAVGMQLKNMGCGQAEL